MILPVRKVRPGATLPRQAYEGDAGLDLIACEGTVLLPGGTYKIPTGIAVAIPYGHVGLLCARSSLSINNNIVLANGVGVIDAGYRGEVVCALRNQNNSQSYFIAEGDKIAQLLILECASTRLSVVEVDMLPDSERSTGGLGSSGR